jgi:rhodanese-related sulfurtransferase
MEQRFGAQYREVVGLKPSEMEVQKMSSSERTIDPKELMSVMDRGEAVVLIDVRRKDDYNAHPQMIPNATWQDPNLVHQWSDDLPRDKKVVVYCVRGGSVSNAVLDHLLARDIRACYIEGGIAAWKERGGPLMTKSES